MGRDRSLDEFSNGESSGSAASGSDGEGSETEPELDADVVSDSGSEADSESDTGSQEPEADTAEPSDDVEPATVTYRWDPGDVECAECGATVEQLWLGESGQVCAECKEW
jgi:hypothetical protein